MNELQLEPGAALYAIAGGAVKPWRKVSREAVDLIAEQDGFMGVNVQFVPGYGDVSLWFFDTEQDAKRARNVGRAKGVKFGDNVSRYVVAADGVPEFDADWARDRGMNGGKR